MIRIVKSCLALLRSGPRLRVGAVWIMCLSWLWCGCRAPALSEQQAWEIRQRSLAELKLSATTADDPQIRVRALRGLEAGGDAHFDSWTRLALYDPAPAVRLEAIMLLRNRRADLSTDFWRRFLDDEDELVRAGAMLCLFESGRSEYGQMLERVRNAEMELRRRSSAIPLLLALNERADDDELRHRLSTADESEGVLRFAARTSLVARGDPEITREMILQAQAGGERDQELAVEILSLSADPNVLYILLERLQSCESLRGRLAAARGVGRFGSDAGLQLALEYLGFEPLSGDEAGLTYAADIRTLACEACAELPTLKVLLAVSEKVVADDDAGVRTACAAAVLRILARRKEAPQ
ncbi:MAG: hypothetical protein IIB58_11220 [Planctomycetes bacterium]|nr:hypothetical protein [Planctomycetota bacterium]